MRTSSPPIRFEFLDGIRALAMLHVACIHALGSYKLQKTLPSSPDNGQQILDFLQRYTFHGQFGVVVFIVLSGYCLMLPVARSETRSLRGGLPGFFKRRALRIIPAYYFAFLSGAALAWLVTRLQSTPSGPGDFSDVLNARNIITHLLIIHNFWFDTAFALNGDLWSVATEWQIYFVFALVLLPLWRRFGMIPTFIVAFIPGILPGLFLPPDQNFYWARPWYLGLFAMGMAVAVIPSSPRLIGLFGWSAVSLGLLITALHLTRGIGPSWPVDSLFGLFTASVIAYCVQKKTNHVSAMPPSHQNGLIRSLEHPVLIYLAGISYSAYLIQHIFFRGITVVQSKLHLSPFIAVIANFLIGIPLILLSAHFVARWFEKPFMSRPEAAKSEAPENPVSERRS